MSARSETFELMARLSAQNIDLGFEHANELRRAQITLHRWAEQECGDSNDYCSWAIERDETTDIPYRVTYPHSGKSRRTRIADRERGALKRVMDLCRRFSLNYYHQGDPRGCALYISLQDLDDTNYSSRGVACCI